MAILHRIPPRAASVAGAEIRRLLPHRLCRKVGPWVFLDHFGPVEAMVGREFDVLPHPHCGLSTVSFLFEGEIEHRDSSGGHAIVRPNEIHWMRAGHGIVHSERSLEEQLGTEQRRHGLQLWCAHADGEEEQEPRFDSWTELPELMLDGVRVQLLAGTGWDQTSPVAVTSPLIYALAHLSAGDEVALPDHEELCVYPVSGHVGVDGDAAGPHELLVVDRSARRLEASTDAVVVILGGDAIGPRHIWWNLVHSDKARLREQTERWRNGEFPTIPGESDEFVAGPERGPR